MSAAPAHRSGRRARLLPTLGVGLCAVLVGCSAGGADRPAASTSVQTNASPTDFTSTTASVRSASPGSGTGSDTGSTSSAGTERVRIVATGDVLLHPTLWAQAEHDAARTGRGTMDFAPMLAGVKPYVASADLALCHLETPLAPTGGPYSGYPTFSGPPQIARALAETGYDVCSTASNHTLDQGVNGVDRTLEHLDRVGIEHAGSARTRREARRTTLVRANGVQVAILSYTYGFNGSGPPTGQSWRAAVIDPDRILRDADRARRAGAQIVVAALHWGTEYSQTPSAEQDALAPKLARSGKLDLIVSHHAHVVEPIEKIGRTWVVHGLGNLLADHATPGETNAEGLLTRFTFERRPGTRRFTATAAEYVPLMMTDRARLQVLDVRAALRTGRTGSSNRSRLLRALHRTAAVVRSRSAAEDGLVAAPLPSR